MFVIQPRQVLGTRSYYCKKYKYSYKSCLKMSGSRDRNTPTPGQPADLTQSPQICEKLQKPHEIRQDWAQILRIFPKGGVCPGSSCSETTSSPLFLLLLLGSIRIEAMKKPRYVRKRLLVRAVLPEYIKEIRGKTGGKCLKSSLTFQSSEIISNAYIKLSGKSLHFPVGNVCIHI